MGEREAGRLARVAERIRLPLLLLALFLAGLALRLPGLDTYLTPDERQWSTSTVQFMQALRHGDWAATTTTGHPGISTTWAGAAGLTLKWLFDRPAGMPHLFDLVAALAANPNRLDFMPWLRLPVALACSLGIVIIFWLGRRLLGGRVALLAAAFLICDPFLIAHSKVLHVDGLLATGATVAWLALLVATRTGRRRYFLLSGAAAGVGVLTKSPALVLGPLMLGWVLYQGWQARRPFTTVLGQLAWTGLAAVLALVLFWPALWVAPLATAGRVWGMMATYGQTSHELGNYWLGQPQAEPGLLFYPTVLVWRAMPVILAGLLLAVLCGALPGGASRAERGTAGSLAVFALWFTLVLSTGDKKFDRYLLPVFPTLDLLAAWGWAAGLRWLYRALGRRRTARPTAGPGSPARTPASRGQPGSLAWAAAALPLIALQLGFAVANRPSYLTTYNPLLGGMDAARRVLLVGWGEGLAEAAAYLNRQPGAEQQQAAAWYGDNVFGPFYRGQSYDLYYDLPRADDLYSHDVDWVVTYINQQQRNLLDPGIERRLGQPVFTSAAQGVALAQVYRWPKPFAHTADRPLASGLRLLGWSVGAFDPATGETPVELDWDAAEIASGEPAGQVSAWVKDAGGEVWATTGGAVTFEPARGVPGWLGRRAQAQSLDLRLPSGLAPGPYRVEMAVTGGKGLGLGQVQVPATPASAPLAGVQPVAGNVTFGGEISLAGYTLDRDAAGSAVLDLLWVVRRPAGAQRQLFVHVIGSGDRIAAQYDGPLARWPFAAGAGRDALLRQRVRLHLPAANGGPYTFYVGVYEPGGGQRLPVSAAGGSVSDNRYPLTQLP